MEKTAFIAYLETAKERLAPARKSEPGVSLYFETPGARRAHQLIRDAKRAIANAAEEQCHGVDFEGGASTLTTPDAPEWYASQQTAIERALIEAGL